MSISRTRANTPTDESRAVEGGKKRDPNTDDDIEQSPPDVRTNKRTPFALDWNGMKGKGKTIKRKMMEEGRKSEKKKKKEAEVGYDETSKTKKA